MPSIPKALDLPAAPPPPPEPRTLAGPTTDGPHHYTTTTGPDYETGEGTIATLTAWLHETNQPPTYLLRLDYRLPETDSTTIQLLQLQVQPEHQNHGHGKRAIRALLNQAQADGYTRCEATTIAETSIAWTVPVDQGAEPTAPGTLAFDLTDADPFYTWLQADPQPPAATAEADPSAV